MHRNEIRRLLSGYRANSPEDEIQLSRMWQFIEAQPNCFERTLQIGHVTGSAWIVSPDRTQTLLSHHRKLDIWVQLGGHADGNPDIFAVALREAREESGLSRLYPLTQGIFDIDIHLIPTTTEEPGHYHYDVRFIFEADPGDKLIVSHESKALAWVSFDRINDFKVDASVRRMAAKTPGQLHG
jgi:8-oxo-dGTP pyrophosphatase MutT (NUDIX family)